MYRNFEEEARPSSFLGSLIERKKVMLGPKGRYVVVHIRHS